MEEKKSRRRHMRTNRRKSQEEEYLEGEVQYDENGYIYEEE